MCAVITKDCFTDAEFVAAIEKAFNNNNTRIFLLHDTADCYFPGEKEQPQSLKGLFDYIALPLIDGYYTTTWNKIVAFAQIDPNIKVTSISISLC